MKIALRIQRPNKSAAKNILWFGLWNLFLNWPKRIFLENHSLWGIKHLVSINARRRQKRHPLGWGPRHHLSAIQYFADGESRGSGQKWPLQGLSGQQHQCCHLTVKGSSEGTMGTGSAWIDLQTVPRSPRGEGSPTPLILQMGKLKAARQGKGWE